MLSWDFLKRKEYKIMLLRDFIKTSQLEIKDTYMEELEDFFGVTVSANHPLELVNDIENYLLTA